MIITRDPIFRSVMFAIALMSAALVSQSVFAAPDKPPPEPQDVNVVNTPNVTVTNPQTSVTVDNASGNPVPISGSVTVGNTSPIPVSVQGSSIVEYKFVGYSTSEITGFAIGRHDSLCRNDYGPSAKWATTKEVSEAVDLHRNLIQ